MNRRPFVVSFVGHSGSGKTTVLEKLIPELKNRGLKVGTIKHHLGKLTLDQPGKDSFRHRQAGADVSMIATPGEVGIVIGWDSDPRVEELVLLMRGIDIVLCEGYKHSSIDKIEVFRADLGQEPVCRGEVSIMAIVSDSETDCGVPRFSPSDTAGLADFLEGHIETAEPIFSLQPA